MTTQNINEPQAEIKKKKINVLLIIPFFFLILAGLVSLINYFKLNVEVSEDDLYLVAHQQCEREMLIDLTENSDEPITYRSVKNVIAACDNKDKKLNPDTDQATLERQKKVLSDLRLLKQSIDRDMKTIRSNSFALASESTLQEAAKNPCVRDALIEILEIHSTSQKLGFFNGLTNEMVNSAVSVCQEKVNSDNPTDSIVELQRKLLQSSPPADRKVDAH